MTSDHRALAPLTIDTIRIIVALYAFTSDKVRIPLCGRLLAFRSRPDSGLRSRRIGAKGSLRGFGGKTLQFEIARHVACLPLAPFLKGVPGLIALANSGQRHCQEE